MLNQKQDSKKLPDVFVMPAIMKCHFTSRLDVDNAEKFPAYTFETALDTFYKIIQEHNNEN